MDRKAIYNQFKMLFPNYASQTELYFDEGNNTIRIRLHDKREFRFQYEGMNNMRFETVKKGRKQ